MIKERIFKSGEAMLAEMVSETVERLETALTERGQATLSVAGGRFPGPFFRALSTVDFAWDKVTITLGDERWVCVDDNRSNEKLVRENLLINKAAVAKFVSLKTDDASPEEAIDALNARLKDRLRWPMDIVFLGMGDDGHTASLFPSSPPEELNRGLYPQNGELVVAARPILSPVPRISMTLPALLKARYIGIHITGASKWSTYETAKTGTVLEEMPIRGLLNQPETPVDLWWSAEPPKV